MKRAILVLLGIPLLVGGAVAVLYAVAGGDISRLFTKSPALVYVVVTNTPTPIYMVVTNTPTPGSPQSTVTLAPTPEATAPIPMPTLTPNPPQPTATPALTPEATVPSPKIVPTTDVPLTADRIKEAERLWASSGVTHYRIRVREVHSLWCYYEISLEVQNEEIVAGTITAHYGPAQSCWAYTNGVVGEPVSLTPAQAARWTVPGLFKIAHEWEALDGAKDMRIFLEFDPELGYPTALSRDNTAALDDEMGLITLQFDPL